jgi:hypothetical protein
VSLKAFFKQRWRALLVCSALQFGVLVGAPMRPEEIRELMHRMNQPKLAHVLPDKSDEGGDGPVRE